ncbi:hypothetical protein FRC08_015950, partial [Ceratobasidium sp. 394]
LEQEAVLKRAAGWEDYEGGWLGAQNVMIVRPSLLTNGECVADQKEDAYRVDEGLMSAWTVSRADVAHFVVEKLFANWERWAGKAWVVSY